jgi:hypothetical protein
MRWFTQHKSLSLAMGMIFCSALLFFVAIIPIYNNALGILTKTKTRKSELDDLTAKVSILSKLDPVVLQSRVDVLNAALPPRKDVLTYLSAIDGLSRELGLTFGGLSIAPGEIEEATGSAKKSVKTVGGVQSLETEIKMRGGQDGVYTFLRSIETVLPLMQIKNIKVSILDDNQYALSLTLGMLWAEPATIDVKGAVTLFGPEEDKYFTQLSEYRRFEANVATSSGTTNSKADLFAPFSVEDVVTPQQ